MKFDWNSIVSNTRVPESVRDAKNQQNYKTASESDYNRIITSASFRRLQDKTQVFPLDRGDFVRTRLTHSLEVASLAKMIAKQVDEKLDEKLPILDIVEVLNCAALLHDIGNPPFGHFGEFSIRKWFKEKLSVLCYGNQPLECYLTQQQKLDLLNYEGNAQALRIVTRLHHFSGNYGMRLTAGVLDTIIKYPCNSLEFYENSQKEKAARSLRRKKVGYYASEEEIYDKIKECTKTGSSRNPLTFILEAADDLAYTFADLEDGYKKGMFSYHELEDIITSCGDEKGKERLDDYLNDEARRQEDQEHLEENKYELHDPHHQTVYRWLTAKQLYCVKCVGDAFVNNYEAIMNGKFDQELIACCSEAKIITTLKNFAYHKIYCHNSILSVEIMGNEIITFFLDKFVDALLCYDSSISNPDDVQQKYISLLSSNYKENYKSAVKGKKDEEKIYDKLLLAADYVAGMTDSYARELYKSLKGY